jgi:hypothetical protein
LAGKSFLLLGQESFQALLRNDIQQCVHLLASLDPAADRVLQGMGNVDHLPLVAQADRQTQCRVLLALLATAIFLSASSLHVDQAAAEKGLIGDALDRLGAGMAFLGRALRSRGSPRRTSRHTGVSSLLDDTITELRHEASGFLNANLPLVKEQAITTDQLSTYGFAAGLLAEPLPVAQQFRN